MKAMVLTALCKLKENHKPLELMELPVPVPGEQEADNRSLLSLDYPTHLWQEQELKSVANITRRDVKEFLSLAAEMNLQPEIQVFELEQANEALIELHAGKIRGAKVLKLA